MQLILGPASSGKTTRLMQDFQADLDAGRDCLLILPTRILKDRVSMDLARQRGGLLGTRVTTLNQYIQHTIDSSVFARSHPVNRISNFESYLMIKLLIEQHSSTFEYFRDLDQYPGLIRMIYSMVQEMRSSSDYFGRSLDLEDISHEQKWRDLQKILILYVNYLEQNSLYDNYSLHRLAADILLSEPRPGLNIYLDGFFDYTSYQLDFLCTLFRRTEAEGCTVSLTIPDIPFRLIQDTLQRLRSDFNCTELHLNDASIYSRLAHSILAREQASLDCEVQEIQAFGAYREIEQVANQISSLVGQQGYHYSDIAVITQDPDQYYRTLDNVFREYSHPFYPGRDELLRQNPLIIFIRTIIRFAVKGIDNAGILSLAHSGYMDAGRFAILGELNDFFPSYIRAGRGTWYHALDKKLSALDWEQHSLEQGEYSHYKSIEHIERHRARLLRLKEALTAILDLIFHHDSHSLISGEEWVSWMASLFRFIELRTSGQQGSPDLYSRDYMAMRKLKDSLQSLRKSLQILHIDKLPFSGFAQLFDEMIRDVRYRYRYYTRDSISFLTPYDARELRFRVVFILGLNEGEFPGGQSLSLSDEHERRQLNLQAGRLLLEDEDSRVSLQLLELYTALTRSSERLYLCHTPFNETGRQLLPSMYLEAVRMRLAALPCIPPREPDEAYSSRIFNIVPSSEWMAIHDLRALLQYDGPIIPTDTLSGLEADYPFIARSREMLAYYRHREGVDAWWQGLQPNQPGMQYSGDLSDQPELQAELARVLDEVRWTPLRIETAGNCRYRFFISELLDIQASSIPREEIQSDLKGLFFHKVMEFYGGRTREHSYDSLPDMEALHTAMEEARTDLAALLSDNPLFDLEWLHYQNILRSFVIREKELRLDGRVLALEEPVSDAVLELPGGLCIRFNGRIDRVDQVSGQNRVIDYKSSGVKNSTKNLRFYIRPLFVNQGILYARALGASVHEVSYISIEKDEIMDLVAQMKKPHPEATYSALWDQKSRELSVLLGLLRSGDFRPYTTTQDMGDSSLLDFYEPYWSKKGVEMEWENKCSYCEYAQACPRKEKLDTAWGN